MMQNSDRNVPFVYRRVVNTATWDFGKAFAVVLVTRAAWNSPMNKWCEAGIQDSYQKSSRQLRSALQQIGIALQVVPATGLNIRYA